MAAQKRGGGAEHEGPEPRIRTLVAFGVVMMLVIVAIIVGAAILGS
jgi:hypothetical protein